MPQANVYTSVANAQWYTDKASISTGNTAVTFNVYDTALGTVAAVGNIYSNAVSVPASSTQDMYFCQYCAACACVLVTCICILHVLELPCLYLLCALETRVCASSRHVLDVLRLYLLCALETRVCVCIE